MKNKSRLLVRYLKYIFWRNYLWQARTWGERSLPAVTAMSIVTLLLMFHGLVVLAIIEVVTGFPILRAEKYKDIIGLCFFAFLWIFPYFYFVNSDRYKKILKEYVSFKETRYQAMWRALAIVMHFIACLVALTILALTPF
jgi:energy-coupling factor transporter transmembrane protein EcfT